MIEKPESRSLLPYLWVAATVLFTVYGQVVLKWQVSQYALSGSSLGEKLQQFALLLLKPWVISAYAAAFLASLAWMMAIRQLAISTAYPFMAMNFVLVMFAGIWLFNEHIGLFQILGICLIVIGVALIGYA